MTPFLAKLNRDDLVVLRDLRNGDITTAAPGDGVLIQTCVSAAAGTCDIDL